MTLKPERSTSLAKLSVIGAGVLFVAGIAGSVVAAHLVARSDTRTSQRHFASSSVDISSHFGLAIQNEEDLVVSTSAFIVSYPRLSQATFARWLLADQVAARYPEVVSVNRIVVVPASRLKAFAAHKRVPAGHRISTRSFAVTPRGSRRLYCFADLSGLTRPGQAPEPAGFDFCSGLSGRALLRSRDTDQGAYQSVPFGRTTVLAAETPLYRGGTAPTSVPARRAAFVGWVGVALSPKVVLDAALKLHPLTAMTLRFGRGTSSVAFSGGELPTHGQHASIDLGHGWSVTTAGPLNSGGMLTNRNAFGVLAGGIAISSLLALLGAVLATGRLRAFRLADQQTIKLREQTAALLITLTDLEAAQAVKDEFLGLVSHELRTPLTSIKGYTELLQDEDLDADVQRYLEVIARNAARLLGLVEDVLLMAQIQNGELPLAIEEVVLNDLLRRTGEAATPYAASKEIEIDIDTQPGIATRGDQVRLEQAFDNLVSNAIKYTPERGGVAIRMSRDGETATIEVSDTGIGIPAVEQDQMFGRFFRTSNARESGIEGTGLGLAITREIIEAHGGTISFDSVEGAGTTFRITLPHAHDAGLETSA